MYPKQHNLATKTKKRAAKEAKVQVFKEKNGDNSDIGCNTTKVRRETSSFTVFL